MTARYLLSIVLGASLIASAALVGAQGGPPPGGRPGMRGPGGPGGRGGMMQKMMDDELKKVKASPAQVKKFHAYMEKSRKDMEAYRKAHPNMQRGEMRPLMEKRRAAMTAFLKKTLNAKQYKQWDADMKAARARFGGGRRGPGGPGGPPGGPGGPPPGR